MNIIKIIYKINYTFKYSKSWQYNIGVDMINKK